MSEEAAQEQAQQARRRTHHDGKGRTQSPRRLRGRHRHFRSSRRRLLGIRTKADAATVAKPGYPECVALIVQIGDHLSKQFDVKG
jgi:hypothetical protein